MKTKKLIQVQFIKVEIKRYSDGSTEIIPTNKGLLSWELLGLFEYLRQDIVARMKKETKQLKP